MLGQVERILHSEIFRNSEGLRRLLRFLAERTAAGEADQLKEYTIGVDGLGKPATYDTHHDAAVRIQVGRLRQKLAEYSHAEGKHDPFIIELPKGGYVPVVRSAERTDKPAAPEAARLNKWRIPVGIAALALLAVAFAGVNWWRSRPRNLFLSGKNEKNESN